MEFISPIGPLAGCSPLGIQFHFTDQHTNTHTGMPPPGHACLEEQHSLFNIQDTSHGYTNRDSKHSYTICGHPKYCITHAQQIKPNTEYRVSSCCCPSLTVTKQSKIFVLKTTPKPKAFENAIKGRLAISLWAQASHAEKEHPQEAARVCAFPSPCSPSKGGRSGAVGALAVQSWKANVDMDT